MTTYVNNCYLAGLGPNFGTQVLEKNTLGTFQNYTHSWRFWSHLTRSIPRNYWFLSLLTDE